MKKDKTSGKDNKFLKWLKRPHGVPLAVLHFCTAVVVVWSIVLVCTAEPDAELPVISYPVFAFAAVLLAYSVYSIVIFAPGIKSRTKTLIRKNSLFTKLTEQYGFKTVFFSVISLVMTVAFAVMNGVSAIRYKSVWYASLTGYYALLIIFRSGVLLAERFVNKKFSKEDENNALGLWKIHLASGAFLILLEIAMMVVITLRLTSETVTPGGQIMAIANATYTFFKIITAGFNIAKARRFDHPVIQSLRNLNFADACMSMVSLTVLLIATFSETAEHANRLLFLKAGVGFAACAAIIALAAVMIVTANKRITLLKEKANDVGNR
ncbi:MAG: hypothetical protein ACI4M0_04240 [Christensenellales bacterium]